MEEFKRRTLSKRRVLTGTAIAAGCFVAGIAGWITFYAYSMNRYDVVSENGKAYLTGVRTDQITELQQDASRLSDASQNLTAYDWDGHNMKQVWTGFDDTGKVTPTKDLLTNYVNVLDRDLKAVDIPRKSELERDVENLKWLISIADQHHDNTGLQAILYFHDVAADIQYYLTGQGEEYGVSNVQGSEQVNQFIPVHKPRG